MSDADNNEVKEDSDYSDNKDQEINMDEKDIEDLKEYICSIIDDYYKYHIIDIKNSDFIKTITESGRLFK